MQIHLAYGKSGLPIELPDDWEVTVVEPRFVPALPEPEHALTQALRVPIQASPLSSANTQEMRLLGSFEFSLVRCRGSFPPEKSKTP